ncbi:MAG: thioredoxin family protein [Fervidicoccaceae archaeon]
MSEHVDRELEELLERLARETFSGPPRELEELEEQCCSPGLLGPTVIEATRSSELRRILRGCRVVVVTFYTPDCPYCYFFEPVFARVASEYKGRAAFVRVNAAEAPLIAQQMMVLSVPQTVLFVDGRMAMRIPGPVDEDSLSHVVREHLKTVGCIN